MRCDRLAGSLSEIAHGEVTPKPRVERHINQCLRCQAELSQHRRIRHSMQATRHSEFNVPRALRNDLARAIAALDSATAAVNAQNKSEANKWVVPVAVMTAVGAAGAAGAIVFATRTKRRIPLPTVG